MHAVTLGDLRHRGHVNRLLAAHGGLGRPHVPVVDMCLQVPLGEVGALAPGHNTAHVEGTTLALLDALDRVCAVVQRQAEETRTNKTEIRNQNFLSFTVSAHPASLIISAEELTPGTSSLPFSHAIKRNHSRKRVYTGSGKLESVYSQVNISDSIFN